MILSPLVSMAFDAMIVRTIRKTTMGGNTKNYAAVPVRATVLSAGTIVCYIGISVFLNILDTKAVAGLVRRKFEAEQQSNCSTSSRSSSP